MKVEKALNGLYFVDADDLLIMPWLSWLLAAISLSEVQDLI